MYFALQQSNALIVIMSVALLPSCGGRAFEGSWHESMDEQTGTDAITAMSGGTTGADFQAAEGDGGIGGEPGSGEFQIRDVRRTTVQGCLHEATLGMCDDMENIAITDLAWQVGPSNKIEVSGVAVGDDSYYPCYGVSPAYEADDRALGFDMEGFDAVYQLYAVSYDFPTLLSMSVGPAEPGDYDLVVWASRLHADCAIPVATLSVHVE